MLYRETLDRPDFPSAAMGAANRLDRDVGGAGGLGRLMWLRGERASNKCPVCSDPGPHHLQLSVPSSITAGQRIIFARCRRCDCRFVMDYQLPAYEEASASTAPLHFYVEQGAGLEFLARSIFAAAQNRGVRNYLDIGCGFGFGPDMATRIFGWNALGLDPGPLAAAGREILGVRIESEHLSIEQPLAEAPYDAIAAMEVIEHIVNPDDFLSTVRSTLSDTGILIMSTPNGRYLDNCPDGGDMLMPILSPGYHAVLYTAEGLAALLRKAGFSNVNVAASSTTLFAVASPSGGPLHAEIEINRGRYVGYLRSRFRDAPNGSAIHTGFGYRLLRALTEDAAWIEALGVFEELHAAILGRLGIDIARPLDVAGRVMGEDVAFSDMPTKYPFCLAGLLFCRGTIAASHERRDDLAAGFMLAARYSAHMLLRSLNAIGISDGEIANLPARAANAMKRLF